MSLQISCGSAPSPLSLEVLLNLWHSTVDYSLPFFVPRAIFEAVESQPLKNIYLDASKISLLFTILSLRRRAEEEKIHALKIEIQPDNDQLDVLLERVTMTQDVETRLIQQRLSLYLYVKIERVGAEISAAEQRIFRENAFKQKVEQVIDHSAPVANPDSYFAMDEKAPLSSLSLVPPSHLPLSVYARSAIVLKAISPTSLSTMHSHNGTSDEEGLLYRLFKSRGCL